MRTVKQEQVQTDSLRGNQVTEDGGEKDEHQGIWNPGQVLQGDVAPQLPMNPFIGWEMEETVEKQKQKNNGFKRERINSRSVEGSREKSAESKRVNTSNDNSEKKRKHT